MSPTPESDGAVEGDGDGVGGAEPARVDRLAIWLPVLFALALMAMAYWAASTWMGPGGEGAGENPAAAVESAEDGSDRADR